MITYLSCTGRKSLGIQTQSKVSSAGHNLWTNILKKYVLFKLAFFYQWMRDWIYQNKLKVCFVYFYKLRDELRWAKVIYVLVLNWNLKKKEVFVCCFEDFFIGIINFVCSFKKAKQKVFSLNCLFSTNIQFWTITK